MKKILLVFWVLIFSNVMLAQNKDPNDCVNAIVVCSNGSFNSNANGAGKQEVAGCNSSFEHNSLWLKITIAQAGKLGFNLVPNDPDLSTDFDFWVYGPNKTCTALGSPIRCCITNPVEAGLSDNITGINGSTLATTAWSGTGGNNSPYVQWLDVKVGETYFIVVDRPYSTLTGDTGFQINWTGTATAGAGAFPVPPSANKIADLVTCTSSNVGFFNLDNNLRTKINPDLLNNQVTFHGTLADAVDGKNPLSGLISVNISTPKPIYARVVANIGGCWEVTDFVCRVFPIPTANIALSKTSICSGENVTVNFTGTPGTRIDYTIDGGAVKSDLLDAAGTFSFTEAPSANRNYSLIKVKVLDGNGTEVCFTDINKTETVTVNPLPTVTGTTTTCVAGTTTLTGSGTANATSPWASSNSSVATVSPTGDVTGVAAGSADITYTDSNGCTAVSTVTINPLATVTGKSSICVGTSTQLTGSGTPAATDPWISSDPAIATVTGGSVDGIAEGTVTITYTDINGCSAVFNMSVGSSTLTQEPTYDVSNYFENQTITITVVGDATYLFSLDGGTPQTSNVFNNVDPGLHSVHITDTDGCTDFTIDDILVIGYPKFFTPNNDTFNDIWNISSLTVLQPNAEIRIFDRFARLLKIITPGGEGWDGTYDGHALPSDDYWFTIRYIDENGVEKLFKAHFSLKR